MCVQNQSSLEGAPPSPKGPADDATLSAVNEDTEQVLPEGGAAAWCAVFGAFLAQLSCFGYVNSYGVYQAFYSQQYLPGESSSAISWIGSLATFLGPGLGLVVGPLFDRGYFYHMWIGGAIIESFSIFMLSLVKPGNYYQILLTQGLAYGIGLGMVDIPSYIILSHYFKRRRPEMMSIVASGTPLGTIAHTIMLNKLLNSSIGFGTSVRISAAFLTALLFLSCVLVHPRYNAIPRKTTELDFWKATKKCFTDLPALFTIIGFTFFQIGYLYPFFYLQIDSLRHGLSTQFSFYTIVIVSVGSFFGRFFAGALLPFLGILDLTILMTVCCGVLIIGMIWLESAASVVAIGLLYGLCCGVNVGMLVPVLGLTADPSEFSSRVGVGVTIVGIGNLVGPPICGALLTSQYIWWRPALFSGGIVLLGGVCLITVRVLLARAAIAEQGLKAGKHPGDTEIENQTTSGTKEKVLEDSVPPLDGRHLSA